MRQRSARSGVGSALLLCLLLAAAIPPATATAAASAPTASAPTASAATASAAAAMVQRHLVPAYFYPDGDNWEKVCDKAETKLGGSIIVMNPASGPGSSADPAYTEAIEYCHQKGQNVIGYVATAYADRSYGAVRGDIDTYEDLYPALDGIFVDEMSNDVATKNYYRDLYKHVADIWADGVVVGGPGSAASTAWQVKAPAVADLLVVFEGPKSAYNDWAPPSWVLSRPAELFAALVYDTPTKSKMKKVCADSKENNAGWVYVTDDDLSNPWDRLAKYWKAETKNC